MKKRLKELLEDVKRRTILWAIFVAAFAYLLSLTSSSMWPNIPVAATILILIRYLSCELEIRKRVQALNIPSHLSHLLKNQVSIEDSPMLSTTWRRKIDSLVIEAAVDDFTCRIVQEFVTDLWYSALSPDKDVPEQIRVLINDIFGEFGQRVRRINLINLLTRDIVDVVANHLELFRQTKGRIKGFESFSAEERDKELKRALGNQLHPALSSQDSECKVLQQLMGGMVAIILRPQDAQCLLMRGLARELLACAVLRPVMNFASPSIINKNIERAILSARTKAELRNTAITDVCALPNANSTKHSTRLTHTSSGLDGLALGKGEDGRTFPAENLDNLWAKGQNYKRKELEKASAKRSPGVASPRASEMPSRFSQDVKPNVKDVYVRRGATRGNPVAQEADSVKSAVLELPSPSKDSRRPMEFPKSEQRQNPIQTIKYSTSHQGEAINSGIEVQKGSLPMSSVHGPQDYLERPTSESQTGGLQHRRTHSSDAWQKLEHSTSNQVSASDFWDSPGMRFPLGSDLDQGGWPPESPGTSGHNLAAASAAKLNCWVVGAHLEKAASKTFAVYSIAVTDTDNKTWFVERRFRNFEQLHRKLRDLPQYNVQLPPKRFLSSSLDDTFVRDRCILLDKFLKDLLLIPSIAELHEVWDFLSIHSKNYAYSKSPSVMKTLAVNVDDAVDDMFRQLKGVSDGFLRRGGPSPPDGDEGSYSIHGDGQKQTLGLDVLSGSNAFQTEKDRTEAYSDDEYVAGPANTAEDGGFVMEGWPFDTDIQASNGVVTQRILGHFKNVPRLDRRIEQGGSDVYSLDESTAGSEVYDEDLTVPPEWTPPKLTEPLLNLVDSIFELQERGWIRRQGFWIAKQILQLGMGDAVDDWLVTQIQQMQQEDVVAGAIKSLQGILWPGGVFVTKARKADISGAPKKVAKQGSQKSMDQSVLFEAQLEAARCAKVVYDVLLEGAPTPLVGLIGKQQYTKCAKDTFYFLQSSVFVKQLAYSLLETLLVAIFPEMTRLILCIRQFPV